MTNLRQAQEMYDAFARGDIPVVLGMMDPQIEWREAESNPLANADGSPFVGPDEIVQKLFMALGGDFEGFAVNPKEMHEAGDAVIVEGRYTGTYKATGKSFDAQFCHVARFRDGKLTSFQQYVDTAQMRDAMGAGS